MLYLLNLRFRALFAIALCIISACTLIDVAIPHLGLWLIIRDPLPRHVDVLFTFGGEGWRYPYSGRLAVEHLEATWIVSCGYHLRNHVCPDTRSYKRVPDEVVDTCTSTWTEVTFVLDWVNRHTSQYPAGVQPVVGLVSSPYHMRRIKVAVDRQRHGSKGRFLYLAIPSAEYPYHDAEFADWMRSRVLKSLVPIELKKIVYYGFFR
jgi:hypothetical protein